MAQAALCFFYVVSMHQHSIHQYSASVIKVCPNYEPIYVNTSAVTSPETTEVSTSELPTKTAFLDIIGALRMRVRNASMMPQNAVKVGCSLGFETQPLSCVIMGFTRISECDHVRSERMTKTFHSN